MITGVVAVSVHECAQCLLVLLGPVKGHSDKEEAAWSLQSMALPAVAQMLPGFRA